MATICWRSHVWQVQIGRRGFELVTASFDSRPQAERWAAQVEGRMAEGRFVNLGDAERTSLDEALDRYVKEVSARKRWGQLEA